MDMIEARAVTKTYRIGVGRARIREATPPPLDRLPQRLFPRLWAANTMNALEDVSFSVEQGSSVGLVGPNGAGKTTLLKVVSGVTAPTRGEVRVGGRIAALIDLLVGFHPELTGRENVYLLGAMHGFGRRAMAPRIERILDFAEIHELAETPLKRFSAGMAARLGFATITALDVEILLVDEVLAVGDASYQRKCINWLDEFRGEGGTLLFVSHNLSLMRNMTERLVRLDQGRVVADGPTRTVLTEYAKAMEQRQAEAAYKRRGAEKALAARGQQRWGAGGARVDRVHVVDPSGGGKVEFEITYEAPDLESGMFCIGFVDEGGMEIGATVSPPMPLNGGEGTVRCTVPLALRSGIYFPVVAILGPDGVVADRWKLDRAVVVDVEGSDPAADAVAQFGPVDISAQWTE